MIVSGGVVLCLVAGVVLLAGRSSGDDQVDVAAVQASCEPDPSVSQGNIEAAAASVSEAPLLAAADIAPYVVTQVRGSGTIAVGRVEKIRRPETGVWQEVPESGAVFGVSEILWTGAIVEVNIDGKPVEVPVALAVGTEETFKRWAELLADIKLDGLVGACAVVVLDSPSASLFTDTDRRIVAVAASASDRPVAIDPILAKSVAERETLAELSADLERVGD